MSISNNLRDKAVEIYLNNLAHKPLAENPAWKIDAEELRGVKVRWTNRYEWDAAADWVETLLYGFRKFARVEMTNDIAQPFEGTVIFQFVAGSKTHDVAIGYSDFPPIDENCARQCALYFKMQFDLGGYAYKNVVPGGYVPDGKRLYYHLSALRKLRDEKNYLFDVYGRFGLDYAREVREKAVGILKTQTSFQFEGGMKKVSYIDFLREVARSKICIDMPGLGSFCFRLMNYLAIGSCVIAYPHSALLNSPLIDREHIVYCREDFSDLTELCEYYLTNADERERIAQNARRFFDLNLHKDNLVKYYLRTCLDRLR